MYVFQFICYTVDGFNQPPVPEKTKEIVSVSELRKFAQDGIQFYIMQVTAGSLVHVRLTVKQLYNGQSPKCCRRKLFKREQNCLLIYLRYCYYASMRNTIRGCKTVIMQYHMVSLPDLV